MAGPKAIQGVAFDTVGVRELLKALSTIDKALVNEVRDASAEIAGDMLADATNATTTLLQRLAVSGVKVKRDRIPILKAGRGQLPGHTARVVDLFYGAEFGGGARPRTQQFPPHRGRLGYFMYPSIRSNGKRYVERWAEAIDKAFKAWSN